MRSPCPPCRLPKVSARDDSGNLRQWAARLGSPSTAPSIRRRFSPTASKPRAPRTARPASPVSWPGPPRRREPAAGQPGRHATSRQRSAGEANIANADVVVGYLVAAPNVGKRASVSPCRWRHDLANHRSQRAHTCTPPTQTSMILRKLLLRAEGMGMSSLTAGACSPSSRPRQWAATPATPATLPGLTTLRPCQFHWAARVDPICDLREE